MDIALTADKGGVGKTTLAYHLATRLKQLGLKVGLIDLDRNGSSSWWVAKAERPYFPAYRLDDLGGALPEHPVRIWDTPAHPAVAMQDALCELCDVVAVVAQADEASQIAAANLYRSLAGRGGAAVRVLFNAMQPNGREGEDSIASVRAAGLEAFDTAIRRYQCYSHAQWAGHAVCDYPYISADKAWHDIAAVADEILTLAEVRRAA